MFEVVGDYSTLERQANIKTVGIGGGGGNAVAHMLKRGHQEDGLGFIMANTDQQALRGAEEYALVLGETLTRGLGAGAKPDVGREAAEEAEAAIRERLSGTDMLFITAGMGGGTGTGAAPVIARVARDMRILTVGMVTRPFGFEGARRKRLADEGIKALTEEVDALVTIPNDKLLPVLGKSASVLTAFEAANDVLRDAVLGISDMITAPGMINVDFADVRTVMSSQGMAKIGTGRAVGENRAEKASLDAINSPLLDSVDVNGARGLLVNITAGPDLSLGEFNAVGETLREYVDQEATVVMGTSLDMESSEEIQVSVVATGLEQQVASRSEAPDQSRAPAPDVRSPPEPALHTESPVVARAPVGADRDMGVPSRPATQRRQRRQQATAMPGDTGASTMDEDYLDIPAFLRRSAVGQ